MTLSIDWEHLSHRPGRVYWITGLSGAGKTTVGTGLYLRFRDDFPNIVSLDGDLLREVFGSTHGHTPSEREQLAMSYSRICKLLSDQGINVVCSTISMFHSVRNWNRENIPLYTEIYIKTPIDVLISRDQKGLYSGAISGKIENVLGINVDVQEPTNPDLVLVNDGSMPPDRFVEDMISRLTQMKSTMT